MELDRDIGKKDCGVLSHHLEAEAQTHEHMRRNIDAWWPRA